MSRCLICFVILEQIWRLSALQSDQLNPSQAGSVTADNITDSNLFGNDSHHLIKKNNEKEDPLKNVESDSEVDDFIKQIDGGQKGLARIQDYPFSATLWFKQNLPTYLCSGTLVSINIVLTVAHPLLVYLVEDDNLFMLATDVFVRLGSSIFDEYAEWPEYGIYDVQSINVHPDWERLTYRYTSDVAVLQLEQPVPLCPRIGLAPLANSIEVDENIKLNSCQVLLWTQVQFSGEPNILKRDSVDVFWALHAIPVDLMKTSQCVKYDKWVFAEPTVFCGKTGNRGEGCREDAGGALVCGKKVTGILSSMQGCLNHESPDIFIRLDDFDSWIFNMDRKTRENIIFMEAGCKAPVAGFLPALAYLISLLL